MEILFTSELGFTLSKAHEDDAGYDIRSSQDVTIPARGKAKVGTSIRVAIPTGYRGQLASRSGLASRGITTEGGVIDAGYRGEIGVILYNHTDEDFPISIGDKITQLIITKAESPVFVMVESLSETLRGSNGFGSSGMSI